MKFSIMFKMVSIVSLFMECLLCLGTVLSFFIDLFSNDAQHESEIFKQTKRGFIVGSIYVLITFLIGTLISVLLLI